jgi:hypothetical protein
MPFLEERCPGEELIWKVRDCGIRVSDFGFLSEFGGRDFGLSTLLDRFSHPV